MVKKGFLFLLLFWVLIVAFMPKEEIYFSLERELAKQGVEINEGEIKEHVFGLTLQDAVVYVKGIKVAKVEKIDLVTLLFYTKVTVTGVQISESLSNMVPERAETVVLTHTVLDPFNAKIFAVGSFGTIEGVISLKSRMIHIDFTEVKKIGTIKSSLQKGEKGWYYETAF